MASEHAGPANEVEEFETSSFHLRFINLERAVARRTFMEKQLSDYGIKSFSRFGAIVLNEDDVKRTRYRRGLGPYYELKLGEIGCFESHRAVWQSHDFEKFPYLVVLEDDVVVSSLFLDMLQTLTADTSFFDIVKLDYCPQIRRYGHERHLNGKLLRPLLQTSASAAAYMISKKAAEQLLKRSEVYCDTLDSFITSPENNLSVWQLFPAVACQAMWLPNRVSGLELVSTSSIDQVAVRKKLHMPLSFKLRREVRVFWANIKVRFLNSRTRFRRMHRSRVKLASDLENLREFSLSSSEK